MKKMNVNSGTVTQILGMLAIIMSRNLEISDEQVAGITNILMSAISPNGQSPAVPTTPMITSQGETVRGLAELASILGVSLPSASKIAKSGKFDDARLDVGMKKYVWDKKKLFEIACPKK